MALAFKSGYLGGPIFPTGFAATMVALALHVSSWAFPSLYSCYALNSATVGLLLGAPLTAILSGGSGRDIQPLLDRVDVSIHGCVDVRGHWLQAVDGQADCAEKPCQPQEE